MSGEPNETPQGTPEEPDGSSEQERLESGLTPKQEKRMLKRAIREKWWGDVRWPTGVTPQDLQEKEKERPLTMLELAALAVGTDLSDKDRRVRRIAVKHAIAMEKQNQADDHKVQDAEGDDRPAVQLTRVVIGSREELKTFESITVKQLGEIIENEPQTVDEEIEDAD